MTKKPFNISLLLCTMVAVAPSSLLAGSTSTPNKERVFIGRIVSTTIHPVPPQDPKGRGGLTITLTCATARTIYEVLASDPGVTEHVTVRSGLGEWCDMPIGIGGQSVLVDAILDDGGWQLEYAAPVETTADGKYVITPGDDPAICGVKLRGAWSSLGPGNELMGDAAELGSVQTDRLVQQGVARVESDGTLFYTSAIRLHDLFSALAHTHCDFGPGYPPDPRPWRRHK